MGCFLNVRSNFVLIFLIDCSPMFTDSALNISWRMNCAIPLAIYCALICHWLMNPVIARFPALYTGFLKSRFHSYNTYVISSPLSRLVIPLSTFRFVMVIGL
ncbi:hypothetical protein T10_1383 [Trichinella papuae]|uniref:Uncharacterized protein n=1 Tax=Trichinella papuae TaxID=268474 RepID=A0A0V1N3Q9_9BILA|nr:hypothetical protein T10_1383 [Trichinella papuae]